MGMATQRAQLNELRLNATGKVFFTAVAAWLVGKAVDVAFRGTVDEVKVVTDTMMASKRFQDELFRPGATVDSVMDRLGLKHAAAREFERLLGVRWVL